MRDVFKKLLDLWIEFGKLLNKIVSPIALSLIYFVAFGLASIASKINGSDLLGRKFEGPSYWKEIEHVKKERTVDDFTRQF